MRRDQPGSKARRVAASVLGVVALTTTACSQPTEVTIAREPAVDPGAEAAAPPVEAGDAEQPAEEGVVDAPADEAEAALYDSAVTAPRARPRVVGGQLVSDRGSLLRGVTLPLDEQPENPVNAQLFEDLKASGLNTVHLYLENWTLATGERAALAQKVVELAAAAQVYVIFGLGAGPTRAMNGGSGSFDIEKVRSFWYYYGGRFADQTHVLFEVQNYPDDGCNRAWQASTMAMQREMYQVLRRIAPSTHIVMMSYGEMPTAATLTAAIDALPTVDWSNASIGTHGTSSCVTLAQQAAVIAAARARGVPLLVTELIRTGATNVGDYERGRTGWMSMRWLTLSTDWAAFKRDFGQPNTTWCPDFGAWPQDSSACVAQ